MIANVPRLRSFVIAGASVFGLEALLLWMWSYLWGPLSPGGYLDEFRDAFSWPMALLIALIPAVVVGALFGALFGKVHRVFRVPSLYGRVVLFQLSLTAVAFVINPRPVGNAVLGASGGIVLGLAFVWVAVALDARLWP